MIAADTNLIIRHLVEDDLAQAAKVRRFFGESELAQESVFLGLIVLCEVCWVLETGYGLDKRGVLLALEELLRDGNFVFQDRPLVEEAIEDFRRLPGQFADHLIGAVSRHHGCSTTWTFDRALAKSARFTLLK